MERIVEEKKRILFVRCGTDVLQSVEYARRAMRDQWDIIVTSGESEALQFLGRHAFDVLVAELRTPPAPGIQFFRDAAGLSPDTVRVALTEPADRRRSREPVRAINQYILKPCSATALRSAVARACMFREALFTGTSLQPLIARMHALPLPADPYEELMEELDEPAASLQRVAELLDRDQSLTVKLLELVNSAAFGLRSAVRSASRAVGILGLHRTRSIVTALYVFSQFDGFSIPDIDRDNFWDHSLKVGSLAQAIARFEKEDSEFVECCYTAGLLHDVGKLILALHHQTLYGTLALAVGGGVPMKDMETAAFKTDHAQVGSVFLGLWGLPDRIIDAVAFHHDPRQSVHHAFTPLAAVHAADALFYESGVDRSVAHARRLNGKYLEALDLSGRLKVWRPACEAMLSAKSVDRTT